MELVDTTSGGRDWFSPSVVVVLTAPHPGGADKKMRTKETSRGVDCISRPGIRAAWLFLGIRVENMSELQDQEVLNTRERLRLLDQHHGQRQAA